MYNYTIDDIADYFLCIVDRESENLITPLKLQKILYYAQGYHLAIYDRELFPEDFQAWAHGPVNEKIYNKYKDWGYQCIPKPNNTLKEFDEELIDFLNDIWATFGIYDGKYLEEQTHKEEPWILARKGYGPGMKCTVTISKDSMKQYFRKVLNENQQQLQKRLSCLKNK